MNRKLKIAAIPTLVAAVIAGALLWGNAAGAQEADEPAPLPQVIYDQQDVTTDAGGRVLLRFDQGDRVGSCLAGSARYVGIAPARNLTDPGNGPVSFQAVQQTDCDVLLRIFNDSDDPIGDSVIRLTYTASAASALGGEAAPPAPEPEPEPEPTPTPDPDPEPGDSLLSAAGGAKLPQGITPVGDVDADDYAAVVPDGVFCYAALLSANDPNEILRNMIVSGPANAAFGVPADADLEVDGVQFDPNVENGNDQERVTARFVHVDCAAA